MSTNTAFRSEIEKLPVDEDGNKVTVVKCHGRLVSENANELKEVVKPLIPLGGRIIIDLGDVEYVDSSGLGVLVGLKISAVKQGLCILELSNVTPRVLELLHITKLSHLLAP
jgi:anti-anti-sigma factor